VRRNSGCPAVCVGFPICGLVHARISGYLFLMLKTKPARSSRKAATVRPSADIKKPFWRGHVHPELTRSGDQFLQNLKEIRDNAGTRGNPV
jgi:hypothetical protein